MGAHELIWHIEKKNPSLSHLWLFSPNIIYSSPHVYWRFLILPKYLNPQFRRLLSYWEIFRSRKPKFCHNIIQNNSFSIVIKLLKLQRVFLAMLRWYEFFAFLKIIFLDKLTCPYNPSPSISCFFSMMFSYFRVIWQVNQGGGGSSKSFKQLSSSIF